MKSGTYPGQAILEIPADTACTAQLKNADGLGVDIIALTGDREAAERLIAGIRDTQGLTERVPATPSRLERWLGGFVNTTTWVALLGFVPVVFYFGAIALGIGELDGIVARMQSAVAASGAFLLASLIAGFINSANRRHRERALPSKPGGLA